MYSMKKMTIKDFKKYSLKNDEFGLYDLRIETIHLDKEKKLVCNHPVGSYLVLRGENLSLPRNQSFPVYGLSALIPLLPAKQRINNKNDWIETDSHVACPDPTCGGAFFIKRTGVTIFRNSEVSGSIGGPNDKKRKRGKK